MLSASKFKGTPSLMKLGTEKTTLSMGKMMLAWFKLLYIMKRLDCIINQTIKPVCVQHRFLMFEASVFVLSIAQTMLPENRRRRLGKDCSHSKPQDLVVRCLPLHQDTKKIMKVVKCKSSGMWHPFCKDYCHSELLRHHLPLVACLVNFFSSSHSSFFLVHTCYILLLTPLV